VFPFEFIIFGASLLGVLFFENKRLLLAFSGMVAVILYKLFITDFTLPNLFHHAGHESTILLNLLGLLVGFELMAGQFKDSRLALKAPKILPDNWLGPFMLLVLIFLMSAILDNIASAKIGDSIAKVVFQGRVGVGYLAGIVAASNAGGAGSVIGDTTTTMMWIAGVKPLDLIHAFLPSALALCVFGIRLSILQQRLQPIVKDEIHSHHSEHANIDGVRVLIVFLMLVGVVTSNIYWDLPAAGLWIAIAITSVIRSFHWKHTPKAILDAFFLLSLVFTASLMPIEKLPEVSRWTVFGIGFVSSLFDNIPLTKLAIQQGGYDWGWLAYAVGFGGSMMWFGSSAGVAVATDNPEFRKTKVFLKESWIIIVAYVVGYAALLLLGWHPQAIHN